LFVSPLSSLLSLFYSSLFSARITHTHTHISCRAFPVWGAVEDIIRGEAKLSSAR
jgi:hypothetical protein